MRKIIAVISLTLDGVMQAPGRPDGDRRGAFEHGGWALAYNDRVMMETMGKGMAGGTVAVRATHLPGLLRRLARTQRQPACLGH